MMYAPILAILAFLPSALFAKESAYYRAIDQNLSLALEDVAENFNLSLKTQSIPIRRIRGEYEMRTPNQFLNVIADQYSLDWFIIDKTLFVMSKTLRKKREFFLETPVSLKNFHHFLKNEKTLMSAQFPVSLDEEQLLLIIQAPENYLNYVSLLHKEYISEHENKDNDDDYDDEDIKEGYGVMVFQLEYAWAADKTYEFSDASYVVPGIVTLLRQLTGAGGQEGSNVSPVLAQSKSILALQPLAAPRRQEGQQTDNENQAQADGTNQESAQKSDMVQNTIILADKRLNAVLVYDDRKLYGYYKKLINRLDRKSDLVEIEAMIVDVAKNHINDLGINWSARNGRDAVGFGVLGSDLAADGAVAVSAGLGGLSTALTSNLDGILAKIKFLETQGESRIVSRPSIVTMDNLEAIINTTQRFFVRVTGYQDSSLYPVEVGTTMRVTPHIIDKVRQGLRNEVPHIQIFVEIEDGAVDEAESTRVDGLPRVQENKVNTQAVVQQGQSLLIGGHIHTTTSDSTSRVPVLGYIPLLGYLFSSQTTIRKEFIRLFIIRPRVYG